MLDEAQSTNNTQSQPTGKLKILISSDNHLGYMEKDNIRGQDSINSFEEILLLANKKSCDMVLLGGDLFHDNLPTRSSLHSCMSLIRQYTFGQQEQNKGNELTIESDMTLNFMDRFGIANFMSDDFRVKLPIFSIHGNHDDPSGIERLCSLDLLSTAGLVNYFGKSDRVDTIDIHPILLNKGGVKVALYGIGNVRDERLYRTFKHNKVNFYPPENKEEWYNILVVHQNRIPHSDTNFLPEAFLPDWADLVVWGHEHQCISDIEFNSDRGFQVLQPGSSVATALSAGESDQKHAFLLEVDINRNAEFHKVPLKTVRPFEIEEISLSEFTELSSYTWDEISVVIIGFIKKMVKKANESFKKLNRTATEVPLPLIRLKVTYQDQISQLSPIRFYPLLEPLVANPKSCLKFYKQINRKSRNKTESQSQHNLAAQINLDNLQLEDVLHEFNNNTQFQLLPQETLDKAVHKLIEKDDKHGVEKVIQGTIKELQKGFETDNVLYKLESKGRKTSIKSKANFISNQLKDISLLNSHFNGDTSNQQDDNNSVNMGSNDKASDNDDTGLVSDSDDDKPKTSKKAKSKTTTTGKGRGSGKGRSRGKGKAKKVDDGDDDDDY